MDTPIHEEEFYISPNDTGADGRLGTGRLCDYIQEAARNHADVLGIGLERLKEENLMWVLCQMRAQMLICPVAGDSLEVQTWPSTAGRIQCRREFVWRTPGGEIMGRAATLWIVANRQTRRIEKLPGFIRDCFSPCPPLALDWISEKLPMLDGGDAPNRITAGESDIDGNNHVNNVRFIEWAIDSLPRAVRAERVLRELAVDFRNEGFLGDEIFVRLKRGEAETYFHSLVRCRDQKELVRLKTVWQPAEFTEGLSLPAGCIA